MDMVSVKGGSFVREDGKEIRIAPFSMDGVELAWGVWGRLQGWALAHGYEMSVGRSEAEDTPVYNVSWHDAVKFCNALSERAGRTPAYYTDEAKTEVYRRGELDLSNGCVKWDADGYRLPTEAEWEYACRAGTTTAYFWGDILDSRYCWDNSCVDGRGTSVMPVAGLLPNPWGLYDISGNALEWCWDWHGDYSPTVLDNPRGPDQGAVADDARRFRRPGQRGHLVLRHFVYPWYRVYDVGFRVACGDVGAESPAKVVEGLPCEPIGKEPEPDSSAAAVAGRLAGALDLSFPGLEETARLCAAGKHQETLLAFRSFFRGYHQERTPQFAIESYQPDLLAKLAACQGRINLFELCDFSTFAKTDVRKIFTGLCADYLRGMAPAALKAFVRVAGQAAAYRKHDFDQLDWRGRTMFVAWQLGMGFVGAEAIEEMALLAAKVPEAQLDLLTPEAVAETVAFNYLLTCRWVKDNRGGACPNQVIHTANMVIKFACDYPYVKNSRALLDLALHNLNHVAVASHLPDGGDLERSFGYNASVVNPFRDILQQLPKELVPRLDNLNAQMRLRHRLLYSVVQPISNCPATATGGTYHTGDVFRDPQALAALKNKMVGQYLALGHRTPLAEALFREPAFERINNWLFGDKSTPPPAFASIAFPYSGYYVFRDQWDVLGCYALLMGSRPGRGHEAADYNSLNVLAYGRNLLPGGGALSYGNMGWGHGGPEGLHQGLGRLLPYPPGAGTRCR